MMKAAWSAVFALASACQSSSPRCELPAAGHWALDAIDLEIVSGSHFQPEQLLRVAEEAARSWGEGPMRVRTTRTAGVELVAEDGHNRIGFVRRLTPGLRQFNDAHAVTHLYQRSTGEIVEADIEIHARSPLWKESNAAVKEQHLRSLLNHELGHVAGLDHCSGGAEECATSVMRTGLFEHPLVTPDAPVSVPSAADRACISRQFGSTR